MIDINLTHIADIDSYSTRQCVSKLKVSIGNQNVILVDVATDLTTKQYSQTVTEKDQVCSSIIN